MYTKFITLINQIKNVMKNYYEILEVSQNASSEVIEKAYKALAKKYHPDANLNNTKEAEEKFKEISEAYEILSNANKKAEYDYDLQSYMDSLYNSNKYNNNDYENLILHTQELENELESLKRNNNTNNSYNNSVNQQIIDDLTSSLHDTINEAYSKAYHDAYIKRLKDYGYKIKYKKSFKSVLKNFISAVLAIIFMVILFFILWQIPSIKSYFIDLYNNNYFLQFIGNIFIKY